MSTKARLSIEQLRHEEVFLDLTPKQQKAVEIFITSGGDRVASILGAYNVKDAEIARTLSYEIFDNLKVVACLAMYFQDDPLEVFLRSLRRAYRNRKITVAQINAMKLEAELRGWGSASLPNLHGQDQAPEPDAEPEAKPPVEPGIEGKVPVRESRIPAGARPLRDKATGELKGYLTADGQYVRLAEVEVTR